MMALVNAADRQNDIVMLQGRLSDLQRSILVGHCSGVVMILFKLMDPSQFPIGLTWNRCFFGGETLLGVPYLAFLTSSEAGGNA